VRDIVKKERHNSADGALKMLLQNTSGAVDRLATAADITEPNASASRAPEWDRGAYWLERVEALIEQYPWPTVLLALGAGYMIARRMR
jgi:hypothetical protein